MAVEQLINKKDRVQSLIRNVAAELQSNRLSQAKAAKEARLARRRLLLIHALPVGTAILWGVIAGWTAYKYTK